MKKIFLNFITICFLVTAGAQETVSPGSKQSQPIVITNATIHVGNGEVINNGSIVIVEGKITAVGTNVTVPANAKTVDAQGKQVYPGLILANSNLGLVEVNSVRATSDVREIGEMNASIRSIVAYNAESKVINTLRPNGVLLANIAPEGGMVSGSSSVVQLDAWNWEDAAYKMDNGIHFNMPSLIARPRGARGGGRGAQEAPGSDPVKEALEKIDGFKSFLREAKAYNSLKAPDETNLKYAAFKGLFDRSKKFYVHASTVKQILVAIDLAKEFNLDMVIVGGEDSWQVAGLLKQNNVAVILSSPHSLPILPDDDVDQPYKTPAMLQKAGVSFAINDDDGQTRGRNLPFIAGTAVAYGLTKEQALAAISSNAAKILGVGDKTGSIEVGKDANIIISEGDILDMKTNLVTKAFIQGREISLENHQTQLFDKYKKKYETKPAF
ncbi:MAG TPA: amidohydrolase family protein [Flavisolibacter sp.]|nr:amidohydrolase family protein [Flavisolibacter sp.]